jgi:phosphoribosylformylglycinamidine synthase
MTLLARVTVSIKPTVNDPQGLSIAKALRDSLGYKEVEEVRAGKSIVIRLNSDDLEEAKERVDEMCKKLLANPVIETYSFEIEPAADRS